MKQRPEKLAPCPPAQARNTISSMGTTARVSEPPGGRKRFLGARNLHRQQPSCYPNSLGTRLFWTVCFRLLLYCWTRRRSPHAASKQDVTSRAGGGRPRRCHTYAHPIRQAISNVRRRFPESLPPIIPQSSKFCFKGPYIGYDHIKGGGEGGWGVRRGSEEGGGGGDFAG